jgi:hypothetical protein
MATCREIITDAARKVGEVSEGRPAPTSYTADNFLAVLQAWYEQSVNTGLFGRLNDVLVSADYTAKEFDRITLDGAPTITYPSTITDCGTTRSPLDLALIVTAGASPEYRLWDANLASWVRLDGLTLDSVAPLSLRGRDGLASLLAAMVIEDYGEEPRPILTGRAGRFLSTISARDGSQRRDVDYEYF